jgi:hypothetical protein
MRFSLFAFAVATGLAVRTASADPPPPDARATVAWADGLVHAIGGTSEQVRHMLRQAREKKAPRRVACLDEALSRVDAALRLSREASRAAHDAAERDDVAAVRAYVATITRLREASRAAASAGGACAAGPDFEPLAPGTTVRVIIDPNVARVSP